MAKRPCVCPNDPSCRHSHCCIKPKASKSDQMEDLLEAFLEFSDSSALSLHLSFEKLLDSRACDSDQNLLIDRALRLGSALLEAGNRSARKRASIHNSLTWALPPDLTIKVCFSFGEVWFLSSRYENFGLFSTLIIADSENKRNGECEFEDYDFDVVVNLSTSSSRKFSR